MDKIKREKLEKATSIKLLFYPVRYTWEGKVEEDSEALLVR